MDQPGWYTLRIGLSFEVTDPVKLRVVNTNFVNMAEQLIGADLDVQIATRVIAALHKINDLDCGMAFFTHDGYELTRDEDTDAPEE